MIDNSGAPASNGTDVGRRRKRWLTDVLDASQGVPTILCCHVPLVPVRETRRFWRGVLGSEATPPTTMTSWSSSIGTLIRSSPCFPATST